MPINELGVCQPQKALTPVFKLY